MTIQPVFDSAFATARLRAVTNQRSRTAFAHLYPTQRDSDAFWQAAEPSRQPEAGASAAAGKPAAADAAGSGGATTALSAEGGSAGGPGRAEEVLQQAHLALRAEIDLDGGLARDDPGPARDAPLPLQRVANPLKPVQRAAQPGTRGISIEEYQRRKGLVSDA